MKLKNITVQVGGFHDHWLRNGSDTSAVLIAAVTKYHYDFICLMDGEFPKRSKDIKEQVEKWIPGFKVHLGIERMYGWGHVISVMNDCPDIDLENADYKEEFLKMKSAGGIAALAHIGYPLTKEKIIKTGKLDELIDGGYTDAVQIQDEKDWKIIERRLQKEKKPAVISGWDSHMLFNVPGLPNCIYDKDFGVPQHFDHSSFMRTIVFSEDNSLESIKRALAEGKSVVEEIDTGKIYGAPYLVELLEENGYRETMEKMDCEYNKYNLESEPLVANSSMKIKFPQKGVVSYAVNKELDIKTVPTDAEGCMEYPDIPMPAERDESYLPILFDDGHIKRYWGIKVLNDIKLRVDLSVRNGKRIFSVYTYADFDGQIVFTLPHREAHRVSAKSGNVLFETELGADVAKIFEYDFVAIKDGTAGRRYSARAALTIAHRYKGNWDNAEELVIDSEKFCGGFGSFRPYPGKDVFSAKMNILWDDEFLYLRYDIVDKIYVTPQSGRFMFLSDCTTFNIDSLFERTHSRDSGCEMIIGFPNEKGEVFCTHTPRRQDGTGYFDRDDNCVLESEMKMEKTDYGRIVTVKIPWKELCPKSVSKGDCMGITIGALNDEGGGLVDNMQWPWTARPGGWLFPDDWGVMALAE